MVTFANMDMFDSAVAENRVTQREPIKKYRNTTETRLGDSVFVRGQYWTIVDFHFADQSVILRRGKQYEVVDIMELA